MKKVEVITLFINVQGSPDQRNPKREEEEGEEEEREVREEDEEGRDDEEERDRRPGVRGGLFTIDELLRLVHWKLGQLSLV